MQRIRCFAREATSFPLQTVYLFNSILFKSSTPDAKLSLSEWIHMQGKQ